MHSIKPLSDIPKCTWDFTIFFGQRSANSICS